MTDTTEIQPIPASIVAWKIDHLRRSIRSRERLMEWTGFAKPHTPEDPAVIAERTAEQTAELEERRESLAEWEAIDAAQTVAGI